MGKSVYANLNHSSLELQKLLYAQTLVKDILHFYNNLFRDESGTTHSKIFGRGAISPFWKSMNIPPHHRGETNIGDLQVRDGLELF